MKLTVKLDFGGGREIRVEKSESEPILECVVETCRSLVVGGGL